MAQDIEVKIKVDTSQAVSGVNKLETGLKGATTQSTALSNSMQGSKQSEFINKLGDGVSKLNPAFGAAIKGANGLILKMWEMAANPVGAVLAGIVVTAKFLYEAFQDSIEGGKELKAAFSALSAIGATVKSAMFELGRALINVTAAAYKFITLDFKGAAESMKKAGQEAANAQNHLGDAVDGTTAKVINSLTKRQQANDKAAKMQAVTQANTDKLLVKSREILMDEDASMEAKKKALAEVTKAENASAKEKLRIAQENLNIKKDEQKLYGETSNMGKKMNQQLRDLTIERDRAEQENYQTAFKLGKQRRTLGKQEAADVKERNDAIDASNKEVADKRKEQLKIEEDERKIIAKENLDKQIDSAKQAIAILDEINKSKETPAQKEQREYEEKKAVLEANNLDLTSLNQQHEANLALITKTEKEKAAAEQKVIDDKKLADAKDLADRQIAAEQAVSDAKRNALDTSLNILQQFAGKNKAVALGILAIQKGLAIADVVTGAAKAIGLAKASAAPTPINPPFLGPGVPNPSFLANAKIAATSIVATKIGAATSIASILAAGIGSASSITAGGGGGASGGSGGGGSISTPATVAPNVNVVGASRTNAIAETIAQQGQQPIRTYVVANDVTTQQGLNRSIVTSASIG
jgi:hypothetical protein